MSNRDFSKPQRQSRDLWVQGVGPPIARQIRSAFDAYLETEKKAPRVRRSSLCQSTATYVRRPAGAHPNAPRLWAYTRWVTKFGAGQKAFLRKQIQDEVGHDELVIPKATRRILGQKYGLLNLPDALQLAKEILGSARS